MRRDATKKTRGESDRLCTDPLPDAAAQQLHVPLLHSRTHVMNTGNHVGPMIHLICRLEGDRAKTRLRLIRLRRGAAGAATRLRGGGDRTQQLGRVFGPPGTHVQVSGGIRAGAQELKMAFLLCCLGPCPRAFVRQRSTAGARPAQPASPHRRQPARPAPAPPRLCAPPALSPLSSALATFRKWFCCFFFFAPAHPHLYRL